MNTALPRPAFYAAGRGTGGLLDWVTLLHPPYTLWHLSYVAIGAALVPHLSLWRLSGTLVAFFLAVGVGAHALDELNGHPLRTGIATSILLAAAIISVGTAIAAGLIVGGWRLLPFVVVGATLVAAYNLEWFGGMMHTNTVFAAAWGAFPVLTGYYTQQWMLAPAAGLAAVAAFAFSWGQRALSTPVRRLRRQVRSASAELVEADGTIRHLDRTQMIHPFEAALRSFAWAMPLIAAALVVARTR